MRSFLEALLKFYGAALNTNQQVGGDVPVVDNKDVRIELALLFYKQQEFQIHDKADAFEAFDKILNIFHTWNVSVPIPGYGGSGIPMNDCLDMEC